MTNLLQMKGIRKSFHGVHALSEVNVSVGHGQIHAIVGENGAGKSTLMKVLSGIYPAGDYQGDILIEGQRCQFSGIADSEKQGIIIIHQELALVPLMTIAENIFLGHELSNMGVLRRAQMHSRAEQLLQQLGLHESPQTPVSHLGIGKQQLVEIAKALAKRVKLLILDEPTASLNEQDSQRLLDLLLSLKASGVSCILISHKLNEVIQVADEITVLRDGKTVITLDASTQSVSEEEIIRHMVGRELHDRYPKRTPALGAVTLEVRDWTVYHPKQPELKVIDGVSFELKQGEILGIAGLMGAGRTELAMSLFGRQYGSHASGQILLDGLEIDTSTVGLAIEKGLAYVTEDRKGLGLVLSQNTVFNATLSRLEAVSKGQVLDAAKEHQVADRFRQQLQIRCPSLETRVMHLSGGNQQKVVLAKWLFTEPRVLILDEPTRGIDVGAKYEIYTIIAQLAAQGQSILMISSELPELLGMCDRIMVLDQGRKVADFPIHEATQERIMTAILASEENLTCH